MTLYATWSGVVFFGGALWTKVVRDALGDFDPGKLACDNSFLGRSIEYLATSTGSATLGHNP